MRDPYDPPPAPISWAPPSPDPIPWTAGDLARLAVLALPLVAGSWWAWSFEPALGVGVTVGGSFVILESWFSALTYLHRHPASTPVGRSMVFVAALVPWVLGLGLATALLIALFQASDRLG